MSRANSMIISAIIFAIFIGVLSIPAADNSYANEDDPVMVSLGDSYSSGEGIPPFYGQLKLPSWKKLDSDWVAHRSRKSWPGQLKFPGSSKPVKKLKGKRWFFVAASGAETKHIIENHNPYDKNDKDETKGYQNKTIRRIDEIELSKLTLSDQAKNVALQPQLNVFEELREKGLKADYVTITIGGNDLGFTKIVSTAAKGPTALVRDGRNSELEFLLKRKWEMVENGTMEKRLTKTYKNIKNSAGAQATIIVAGYPKLISPEGSGLLFTSDEAKAINDKVVEFDEKLAAYVGSCKGSGMSIEYASVIDAFGDKGAYAKGALIRPVELIPRPGDINLVDYKSTYSFHPNKKGAEMYAKCVQAVIDKIEIEKEKEKEENAITHANHFKKSYLIGRTYAELEKQYGPLEEPWEENSVIHYQLPNGLIVGFLKHSLYLPDYDSNGGEEGEEYETVFNEKCNCCVESGTAESLFGLKENERLSEKQLMREISAKFVDRGEPNEFGEVNDTVIGRIYEGDALIQLYRDEGERGTDITMNTNITIDNTTYLICD